MSFSINVYPLMIISLLLGTLYTDNPNAKEMTMPKHDPKLLQALADKGKNYKPRTEHLKKDGSPIYINQLILKDSPYLLQHAHNPVNWYSWSKEAFALARTENKPIFLSVGYSTCHWCHVMEKESFENVEIAKYLNDNYIAIKVDREQHPQIDNYYMSALISIKRSGGWPMSAFLLPDGKTFHADTYIRPEDFLALLKDLTNLWHDNKSKVEVFARQLAKDLQALQTVKNTAATIDKTIVATALATAIANTDDLQGGFGSAPKFPRENILLFMLEQYARDKEPKTAEALWATLDAMAHGGIYDQVGGGFHRYSTDNQWLVPHFEKMLYNQAMLARVYTQASRFSDKTLYAQVAKSTLDYVLRDLTDSSGAFHSATDADSGKSEGEYFVWSIKEIDEKLSHDEAQIIKKFYGLTTDGNFEGENILFISKPHQEFARELDLNPADFQQKLSGIHAKLLNIRNQRPLPFKDEKIISAWNGLMISALAEGYQVFAAPKYLNAANTAAEFIWSHFKQDTLPRILNSKLSSPAVLEDYAFVAEGILALYDATLDDKWLKRARKITNSIMDKFYDEDSGAYFMNYVSKDEPQIPKIQNSSDGAIYSATAALHKVLQRLYVRTGDDEYEELADKLLSAISGNIKFAPTQNAYILASVADKLKGEVGTRVFAGRGHVKIKIKDDAKGEYVELEFDDKWHINSDLPLDDYLIPTKLQAVNGKLDQIQYPEATVIKLGFSQSKLALYSGNAKIYFTCNAKNPPDKISLTLQACNDKKCLPPETRLLLIPKKK